jgi:hypothetical protein
VWGRGFTELRASGAARRPRELDHWLLQGPPAPGRWPQRRRPDGPGTFRRVTCCSSLRGVTRLMITLALLGSWSATAKLPELRRARASPLSFLERGAKDLTKGQPAITRRRREWIATRKLSR